MKIKCGVCKEDCRFLEIIHDHQTLEQKEWYCHYYDDKIDLENDEYKICKGCDINIILRPEKILICSECEVTLQEANPELAKLDRHEKYPVIWILPTLPSNSGGPIVCPKDVSKKDVEELKQRLEDIHHYSGDLYFADIGLLYKKGWEMQEYCLNSNESGQVNDVICLDEELFYSICKEDDNGVWNRLFKERIGF